MSEFVLVAEYERDAQGNYTDLISLETGRVRQILLIPCGDKTAFRILAIGSEEHVLEAWDKITAAKRTEAALQEQEQDLQERTRAAWEGRELQALEETVVRLLLHAEGELRLEGALLLQRLAPERRQAVAEQIRLQPPSTFQPAALAYVLGLEPFTGGSP